MRSDRTRRLLAAAALAGVSIALFATIWTVVQAPNYALWLFSIGATELSLFFGVLGIVGAGLGCVVWRHGGKRAGIVALVGGLVAFGLSLLPLLSALPVAARVGVHLSLATYFGMGGEARPTVTVSTQPYAEAGGQRLLMDCYRQAGVSEDDRLPAIVVVHGGSWRQGNRSDFARWDRWLAAQGYAVFDIDYRLAPQPNWGTATADVQAAVGFVRANAARIGVRPDRIALLGRSAGGHLALLAAYTAPPASRVACVVSLYGPTDLVWGFEHVAHPDIIHGRAVLTRFLGGTLPQIPAIYAQASPIDRIDAGAPPTLLLHGGRDMTVGPQHSEMLAARLGPARSRLVVIPYALHGYDYFFDGWGSQITRPVLLRFLREYLR